MAEPPNSTGRERRSFAWHEVDSAAAVFLVDLRIRIPGRIVDVSLGGCRIRSQERFPVGIYRRVEVEFTLDGLPSRLAGVVQALHDPHTIGIRLLDLSERKREQLTALMEELEEAERRESGANEEPRHDFLRMAGERRRADRGDNSNDYRLLRAARSRCNSR